MISSIDAPDANTVIFHLKEPYASFLWNIERSAVGIVPADAPADFCDPSAPARSIRKPVPGRRRGPHRVRQRNFPRGKTSSSASSPTPSSAPSNSAKVPPKSS